MGSAEPGRWHLDEDEVAHEVTIEEGAFRRTLTWSVCGERLATQTTSDERVVLTAAGRGSVGIRLPSWIGPARRVTFHAIGEGGDEAARAAAWTGLGGVDLAPEPGSRAARREAWIRAHPRLHAARAGTLAALAVVATPLLLWLWNLLDLPPISIVGPVDWPNLPRIPWPDLPTAPWPDIDWPDLPDLTLPAWLRDLLSWAKYVWPVLLAVAIAHGEVRRRRHQDARRKGVPGAPEPSGGDDHGSPAATDGRR
ncbi:MAG: hypothetical protein ACRCYX_08115 [Dermatophilaceae bacterium]